MNPIEDMVTGLRNRRSFMSLLRQQVGLANDRRSNVGLLVVDIAGFSRLNATHGFDAGDQLLKELGSRLKQVARQQDYVARIGDNRFALVLVQVMNTGHMDLAARKLFRLLELPFECGASRCKIVVTVGAALCPAHASQSDHLLRVAEQALAGARATGLPYQLAPDLGSGGGIPEHWDLEVELGSALERGDVSLHYQPKLNVADRRLVGAEALMRWDHRVRGAVSPELFIPIAEKTGQIRSMTAWALNTSLRHARQWPGGGRLSVAVNVPAQMIARHDLPELVENALNLWGGNGTQLVLEITERSLVADYRHSSAVLARIRDLGVRISIDDFGTGYSCLAYFRDIPADELKIDRSFIRGLLDDTASVDITTLIIDLAHRFGMSVVGEGVEDEATFQALARMGCDTVQGYHFSPALSADAFARYVADARGACGLPTQSSSAGAPDPSAILDPGARSSAG